MNQGVIIQDERVSMADVLKETAKRNSSANNAFDCFTHPEFAEVAYQNSQGSFSEIGKLHLSTIIRVFTLELSIICGRSPQAIIVDISENSQSFCPEKKPRYNSLERIKGETSSGFLTVQTLATLLDENGINSDSAFRFYGGAYGCCPTMTAQQLFLALQLGIAMPFDKTHFYEYLKHISWILIMALPLIQSSRFRMGTLFQDNITNNPSRVDQAVTLAMHDDDRTRIYPQVFLDQFKNT